jgi:hypothetical protein
MARSLFADGRALRPGEDVLRCLELVRLDDRGVRLMLGPHPLAVVIPAHLRLVAERHVFNVEENLLAALSVPDLPPGVARVLQDRAHCGLRPCAARPLSVTVFLRGRARTATG